MNRKYNSLIFCLTVVSLCLLGVLPVAAQSNADEGQQHLYLPALFTNSAQQTTDVVNDQLSALQQSTDTQVVDISASSTNATIASDLADYPPGATVTLTGAGWQPGESVDIFVNDDSSKSWYLRTDPDPIADETGAFTYSFQLPNWFVANYSVIATGSASGIATTAFTDLAIGTYDQCSNDLGTGYTTGDTGCRWINGNLQSNNSRYFEGDATVQRVWLKDFAPGSTHSITLKYGTTKGGKHAYDFLTTWDWSEDWITLDDRCQDITGCTSASENALDIPQDPNVPNSFEPSAAGDRQFVMRGGILNSATTPVIFSGSYAGDSETIITINFTVASSGSMCPTSGQGAGTCSVALWFGAHVAAQANWGLGQGAGSIEGSPYHVALDAIDGAAVGQRDNQMQANAVTVIPNGTIVIVKDAVPNDAHDFSFNLNNNGTISQDFALDDDSDVTLPNSQTFSVPPGTWTASELNIPSEWSLTDLTCNDPTNNTTVNGAVATINLASNETVTCTYTNTKEPDKLDLTVTKTATPSFTRTFTWGIEKKVDKTTVNIPEGGSATFNYTVDVTHNNGVDSGWAVNGTITVNNPNSFSVSGVSVSDTIGDANASCTVTGGSSTIATNGSATFNYSCTYSAAPAAASQTNTATASWTPFGSPNNSASGTASVEWNSVSPTLVDESVSVTDPLDTNSPRTFSHTDPSPSSFSYSRTASGEPGKCTKYDNTATFTTNDSSTKGSSSQTVTVCVGKDLTVSKTATATFKRTFTWDIAKKVDKTQINIAEGGEATFEYTVDVTHSSVDSDWAVTGKITVANPNDWQDLVADVSDSVDNGGSCTVVGGTNVSIPKAGQVELDYTCTYANAPTAASGVNTATATWDKIAAATPNGSASGTANFGFTNPTIVGEPGPVTVTDNLFGGTLGTVSASDASPKSFTYTKTFTGVAGTCTKYDNTATIVQTSDTASQTVTVCVGKDLTVAKTVTASFDRTYKWLIDKSVDDTRIEIAEGSTATFNYTVKVTPNGVEDSGYTLAGTITVANPNDWQAITADVTDTLDQGGTCTVDGGTDVVIPAGGSKTLNYTCTTDGTTTKNTATVTWDRDAAFTPNGTDSDVKDVTFALDQETNKVITVVDDKTTGTNVTLGTSDYNNGPFTFTYAVTQSGEPGKCQDYTNTATIDETGQSDNQTVTVCVGKDLTVSKTATASFDRTYKWLIDKSVDDTRIEIAQGGTATFNYSVKITPDGFTDDGYLLGGTITINNPNSWQDVTVNVADTLNQGGTCTITESAPYVVPKGDSLTLHYTCSTDGTTTRNTATITWDKAAYFTSSDSAAAQADVNFALDQQTNKIITVIDDKTDPANPVTLGTRDWADGEHTFTYSLDKSGVAGTCKDYTNTAVIDETDQSDTQKVTVCVGKDLTVSKTATTAFTRTYSWGISKSVDKTKVILEGTNPQSALFNYTVAVSHDSGTDSGWQVNGTITVNNPNDWQAVTADVSDAVNNGGGAVCSVTNGNDVVIAANGSATLNYSCSFSSKPNYSGLNTATATWDATTYHTPDGSATGTAAVNFTTPTTIVDGNVTVVDDKTDPANPVTLGTVSYSDPSPKEFKYSLTKSGVAGDCRDYTNTATVTTNTTNTEDSASQTVTVCSSLVTLLKLTSIGNSTPAVDPSMNWTFNLYSGPHANDAPGSGSGWLGSTLASDNTSGDADGLLDFDFYHLNPAKTYVICEMSVPSGYTVEWKVDTNGDGTPDAVVIPYNPNAKDALAQDLGTRCFDFGAGTSYPIPEGGTLAFQVINRFPGGSPRTPGYWKNWNRCTGGGQAANADRNGGRAKGYTLLEDILTSPGIIWDDILSDSLLVPITQCDQAVEILDQRVVIIDADNVVGNGKKLASDGARTLAMHLLAAQLNEANGACINQDIKDVILKAETLLDKINFNGTQTTAYLTPKSADYAYALKLAAYLDAYNNSDCKFSTLPPKP